MKISCRLWNLLGVVALSLSVVACSTSNDGAGQEEVVYVDEDGNPLNPAEINMNEYEVVEEQSTDTSTVATDLNQAQEGQSESVAIEMDSSTEGELRDMLNNMGAESSDTSVASQEPQALTEEVASAVDESTEYVEIEPKQAVVESEMKSAESPVLATEGMSRYIIQSGDTLSEISQRIYGSFRKWRELAEQNQIANPDLIFAGDVLYYDASQALASYAQQPQPQTIVVEAGETLSSISQKLYGTPNNWKYLATENSSVVSDPNRLEVGTTIKYQPTQAVARKPKAAEAQEKQEQPAH